MTDPGAGVTCLRCGYDLRGVDADGVCPECGLSVEMSTRPRDRLQDCPPGWVLRMAVGAGVLALAWVLFLPAGMVWMGIPTEVMVAKLLPRIPQAWTPVWMNWPAVLNGLIYGGGLAVQIVAVWVIGVREKGESSAARRRVRIWFALAVVAIAAAGILSYQTTMTPIRWVARRSLSQDALIVLAQVLQLAVVACPAVGLWHVKRLTERIGRPKLAEYAGIVGAGLSTVLLLALLRTMRQEMWMLEYQYPALRGWWPFENVDWLGAIVPPGLVSATYWMARQRGGQPRGAVYGWVGALYLVAAGWAALEWRVDVSGHAVWRVVLVLGVPLATGMTFYVWGLLVLARTAWKLGGASREARAAWGKADATVYA